MPTQRVALVTGASSGIGKATAEALALEGFVVFGTSRRPSSVAQTSWTLLPLDVCSDESVATAVRALVDRVGRIDVLVNNAGYVQQGVATIPAIGE